VAASKPRLRSDVALVEIDQEAIAYDPKTGYVHYLNPMASILLQLCDGTATVKETTAELAEAQEMTAEELRPSIDKLMRDFRAVGLVTPSARATRILEEAAKAKAEIDERAKIRREVPRSD
jgi:PqqD family protein of HPr-rel-A system